MWYKLMVVVLLAVLIVVGIVLVNAVDRMYFGNQALERRLTGLEAWCRSADFTAGRAAPSTVAAGEFANAEFFDPLRVDGDRMVTVLTADPADFNPLTNNEANVRRIYALCQSALGERNYADPTQFQPVLAESWQVSEDHLTYRIKLRRGVYWHDVTDPVTGARHERVEMTAHDFRFFFDVMNDPEVNCAMLRVYYQDVAALNVLNDYEFEVVWKTPYFRSLEMTLALTPLPRHFYSPGPEPFDGKRFNLDHERNRMVVGVGPYQLESWDRDTRIVLRRNETYFGRAYGAMPALTRIVFEIIKLENTRFQALTGGQIDECDLSAEQWVKRTGTAQFVATLNDQTTAFDAAGLDQPPQNALLRVQGPGILYSYIAYNLRNPLFADRRVRQALTLLTNREKILSEVFSNLGTVVSGPFQPESPYYDRALAPWPFDPARAKALLAEAGWRDSDGDGVLDKDGQPFEFTMMQAANSVTQEKMMPILKESLAAAGIRMRIDVYEWSVFLQRIDQRNFEACSLAWTIPFEADPYQVWHSSQAELPESSNFIGFVNPEADRLIEAIRLEFDVEQRIALCHAFQRLLHEEQPYTFLFAPAALSALSARYNDVRMFPLAKAPTELLWSPVALRRE